MKWLLLVASIVKPMFLTSSTSSPSIMEEIKFLITKNIMKAAISFAAITSLSVIFAAGIVIVSLDIGAQLDQTGTIFLSSIIIAGIILSTLSLVIVAGILNSLKIKEPEQKELHISSIGTDHPIQDAIALLIADFVKEREFKRNVKKEQYLNINDYSKQEDHNSYYSNHH